MKKSIIYLILFFVFSLAYPVYSTTSMNFLTKGLADLYYCQINGTCYLNNLWVDNLSVIGQYLNVTVTNIYMNVTHLQGEHWVNESGEPNLDLILNSINTSKGQIGSLLFENNGITFIGFGEIGDGTQTLTISDSAPWEFSGTWKASDFQGNAYYDSTGSYSIVMGDPITIFNNLDIANDLSITGVITTNGPAYGHQIGHITFGDNILTSSTGIMDFSSDDIITKGDITLSDTLKLNKNSDMKVLFSDGTNDDLSFGYDLSEKSFVWHRDYTGSYPNFGQFGDLMILTDSGSLELNPDGFSNGGKITATSKVSSDTIETIYQAGLNRGGGNGGAGLGLAYLFRLENGGGTIHDAGKWIVEWTDSTAGSEDTKTTFQNMVGGSFSDVLVLDGNNATFKKDITALGNLTIKGNANIGKNFTVGDNKFEANANTNYTYWDKSEDIGVCWNATHIVIGEEITGSC